MNLFRLAVACVLCETLAGCGSGGGVVPEAGSTTKALEARRSTLTFLLSGDTAGYIVPCGCTTKQYGGLPRRAAYLKILRGSDPNVIYVDAGGSVAQASAYDALKFEYILRGTAALRPAAMNIGSPELLLGARTLAEMVKVAPLFSTNVRPKQDPSLWPEERIVEFEKVRVGFLGVCLAEAPKDSADLDFRDPHAALQQRIPELAARVDALILLAHGDRPAVSKLAADFPELSAVFIAGTGQSVPPAQDGISIVAGVAQKGKFLARVSMSGGHNAWTFRDGEIVELSESYADDAEQMQNLLAYKQRLKREKLTAAQAGLRPQSRGALEGYSFAGSAACAKCHPGAAAVHAGSRHAQGLETLRRVDFEFDPNCLRCHVTGYGETGGFVHADATPALGGIGCENCHGPAQAHVLEPRTKTVANAKGVCLTCHDPENSPKFEFDSYWRKIAHAREAAK